MNKETLKTWANSTISHVLCSFFLMGLWAVIANRSHPMPAPVYAGLLQGALSGGITLVMKKSLEAVFQFWVARGRAITGLFATPLIVSVVSASSLLVCHVIAGTPELIATIIIPSSVGLFYGCTYCYAMWRHTKPAS